ncbi:MAG: hydroxymethylbilane synthase [Acidimicrobiia bacterium]
MSAPLRVATRGSALARTQTSSVVDALGTMGVAAQEMVIETTGDVRSDVPIHSLGGVGVFVKEIEEALLDGRADVAVHSAKDLPSELPDGLVIAAVPERADPRDALVGSTLDDLVAGARVGTGSVRRRSQLASARPDLTFGDLRGNIGTRLDKAADFDAVVVAAAALDRLDRADAAVERLDPDLLLPQVGQGALALECRADDADTRAALAPLDRADVHTLVRAERAFLAELGGGCTLPVGALAEPARDGVLLRALLASLDGHIVLRTECSGDDPEDVGITAAGELLHQGGARVLEDAGLGVPE